MSRLSYYLMWPVFRLHLHNTTRARVLIVCGDEVLLVRPRFDKPVWKMPGGGLKPNEQPSAAAVREIWEELGLEIQEDKITHLFNKAIRHDGYAYTSVFMAVEVPDKNFAKHWLELKDAKWFNRGALPEPTQPLVARAIKAYDKQLKNAK